MSGKKSDNIPIQSVVRKEVDFLSKTPGGTVWVKLDGKRTVYDFEKMKLLSSSPLSRSPISDFPKIPGITKNCPRHPKKKMKEALEKNNDDDDDDEGEGMRNDQDEGIFKMDL